MQQPVTLALERRFQSFPLARGGHRCPLERRLARRKCSLELYYPLLGRQCSLLCTFRPVVDWVIRDAFTQRDSGIRRWMSPPSW